MKRFAFGALVVAVIAAGPVLAQTGGGQIVQQIFVKVNGDIFTQTELETRQIAALRERKLVVTKPEDLQTEKALASALAEVTPAILVEAVDELLIIQRARELGYKFTDDRFKDILTNIKKDNKLDDAQFNAALIQEGLTLGELREKFEREWLGQAVLSEAMQRVTLTEQEAQQYYKAHPDEFMKPASIVLREILVAAPVLPGQAVSASAMDAATAKAREIRERILKGEAFAKVAEEVSDSASKAKGGLMGSVNPAEINPALRTVLEKLKPGDVSEPFPVGRGVQLFAVDSVTAPEVEPFQKVRDKILQSVQQERAEVEKKKYVVQLRAAALIEWKNEQMKEMYLKGLSAEK